MKKLLFVVMTLCVTSISWGQGQDTWPFDYRATSPEGRNGIATPDLTDVYMFHTYVQNQDIPIELRYIPPATASNAFFQIKIFHEYNNQTTDITDDNSALYPGYPSGFHYTNDMNTYFYVLKGNALMTHGAGRYRLEIKMEDLNNIWMSAGTIDIIAIPKLEKLWLEATPICENTYLQSSSGTAPFYSFKIKTEPTIDDIFLPYYLTNVCFAVEGGSFDPITNQNMGTQLIVDGLNGCNMNSFGWNNMLTTYPSIVDYSIDGYWMYHFFHSQQYPSPLQIKVTMDDQVVTAPMQIVVPIIVNTAANNINNAMNPTVNGPAFHDYDYTVNGKEIWTPTNNPAIWKSPGSTSTSATPSVSTYRIQHNLIITPGSYLTIKDMNIEFGPNAKVIVQANPGSNDHGGRLKIDNSTLTAYDGGGCFQLHNLVWEGITVQGNSSKHQYTIAANTNGANTYQGLLEIENGSDISSAYNAVKLWDGSLQTGGGIIKARYSSFTNNRRAVNFEKYNYFSTNNISYFEHCNFVINSILPSPFFCFISGWGVNNVRIKGCNFLDNAQDPNSISYGIIGEDASFVVDQLNSSTPSTFWGLKTAFRINDLSGLGGLSVKNSYFDGNKIAVHSRGVKAPVITNNEMLIPGSASLFNYIGTGVYLETGSGYSVHDNIMYGDGGQVNTGVLAWNTGTDPNEVKRNSYEDLAIANLANYVNRGIINGDPAGLQYLCNTNNGNLYDIAAIGTDNTMHGIRAMQGSSTLPTGNQFSSAFTNHVDIYNPAANVGAIDYYYQMGQAPNNIAGAVNATLAAGTNNCETPDPNVSFPDGAPYVYKQIQKFLYAEDEMLDQPEHRRDSLYHYVRVWNSAYGRVMETDMLMEDGEAADAVTLYNSIVANYTLEDSEAAEFAYGKRLLDVRVALLTAGKTMKEIDEPQIAELENIADSAAAWAKVRAQNWLTLYDGRQFTNTILWPKEEPQMRKAFTSQDLANKLYPNPVQDLLMVNYQNKDEHGALLQILDVTGRKMLEANLEGLQGHRQINVSKLTPGIYLYNITANGSVILQGKFVKE